MSSGDTSVDEMKNWFEDDAIMYAYVRVELGSDKRQKFAYIKWVGDNVKPMQRAKAFEQTKKIQDYIKVRPYPVVWWRDVMWGGEAWRGVAW